MNDCSRAPKRRLRHAKQSGAIKHGGVEAGLGDIGKLLVAYPHFLDISQPHRLRRSFLDAVALDGNRPGGKSKIHSEVSRRLSPGTPHQRLRAFFSRSFFEAAGGAGRKVQQSPS